MSRRELLLWLAAILLASQIFRLSGDSAKQLVGSFVELASAKSAFYYLAWYAVFRLLAESDPAPELRASDTIFLIGACCVSLLPANTAMGLAVTAASLFVWVTSAGDRKLVAAANVLLALALNSFWGPQIFEFFAFDVVRIDAALVGTLLSSLYGSQIFWHGTIIGGPGGHGVLVYGPCSSFHNISLGLLGWVAITKLCRTEWVRSDILIGSLVCLTVVGFNTWRLSMLVLRPEHFEYWHLGFGSQIFSWATSITVLALSFFGIAWARRQR
jgi:hypothetical protein